jgi:hypothetical protein
MWFSPFGNVGHIHVFQPASSVIGSNSDINYGFRNYDIDLVSLIYMLLLLDKSNGGGGGGRGSPVPYKRLESKELSQLPCPSIQHFMNQ